LQKARGDVRERNKEKNKFTGFASYLPKETNQINSREYAITLMSVLAWNVRGLNKKERRKDLKDHMVKYSPSIVVVVVTKIRPHKKYKIWRCIPKGWGSVNNNEFSSLGRIWIC